jgi:hypothetical protein
MADKACCASVSLDSLPGPALQLLNQFVGRDLCGRTPLLRTSRALRYTVLAGSKSIKLNLRHGTPADVAAHRQLLRRSCAAAPPGLALAITAPWVHTPDRHVLCDLLEPVKDEGLPNVHVLALQVC